MDGVTLTPVGGWFGVHPDHPAHATGAAWAASLSDGARRYFREVIAECAAAEPGARFVRLSHPDGTPIMGFVRDDA